MKESSMEAGKAGSGCGIVKSWWVVVKGSAYFRLGLEDFKARPAGVRANSASSACKDSELLAGAELLPMLD